MPQFALYLQSVAYASIRHETGSLLGAGTLFRQNHQSHRQREIYSEAPLVQVPSKAPEKALTMKLHRCLCSFGVWLVDWFWFLYLPCRIFWYHFLKEGFQHCELSCPQNLSLSVHGTV